MTLHKGLKILLSLLILLAVAIGLTSINHPIILKWVTGSAKHHGKPIPATIYTNGQVNDKVKVFYSDEPQNYIVSVAEYDSSETFKFFYINLKDKWLGKPAATSKKDYDFIAGHLFQSETGARFSPFQDDLKGFNFDPRLSVSGKKIQFNLPPGKFRFDSVRIILP